MEGGRENSTGTQDLLALRRSTINSAMTVNIFDKISITFENINVL